VIGVTADTNIYISGFVFGGIPRDFILAAENDRFRLATSDQILNELSRTLRQKFDWPQGEITDAMTLLAGCTSLVRPTQTIDAVPADPDDNRVLECAVQAKSQFIVTGDAALLRLSQYGGIQIVRVADFMKLIPPA
jgi:putative PIN family toxin of toxin-antitoxin system